MITLNNFHGTNIVKKIAMSSKIVKKTTYIKERILNIAETKGLSKEIFFSEIGMSYGNFKGKAKNTALNSDSIAKILTIHNEINPIWLIIGEGEMFLSNEKKTQYYLKDNVLELEDISKEGEVGVQNIGEDKKREINLRIEEPKAEYLQKSLTNDYDQHIADMEKLLESREHEIEYLKKIYCKRDKIPHLEINKTKLIKTSRAM